MEHLTIWNYHSFGTVRDRAKPYKAVSTNDKTFYYTLGINLVVYILIAVFRERFSKI